MLKWYVVQVISAQEKKVKKALEQFLEARGLKDFIAEILIPTENVSEVKQGEMKVSEKRIWPGYLLIKMEMNDQTWNYIKGTNGVIAFLGGETPTALTDQEVEQILQDLQTKKEKVVHKHKVDVGDTVKICDGVFVNFVGTVTEVFQEKGRLTVLVSIFGRDTRVEDLGFWQVEQVNSD
jgi:transcription termination/antitermination protein NusG